MFDVHFFNKPARIHTAQKQHVLSLKVGVFGLSAIRPACDRFSGRMALIVKATEVPG